MISHDDYFRFAKQRETLQKNIQDLLERFPDCREHYSSLVNFYWYYIDGLHRWIPREVLRDLTSPESITRTYRQVIKEIPRLAPTPKTQRARDEQLERMSKYYREEARKEHLRH